MIWNKNLWQFLICHLRLLLLIYTVILANLSFAQLLSAKPINKCASSMFYSASTDFFKYMEY